MTPVRLPICRPLVGIETAKAILGVGEDKVLGLVDSGSLVAWDLRAANASRSLLRILTQSLRFHADGLDGPRPSFTYALGQVLPGSAATVLSSQLAWSLGVSSTHVGNLVLSGSLKAAGRRAHGKASLPITRASVVAFLEARGA